MLLEGAAGLEVGQASSHGGLLRGPAPAEVAYSGLLLQMLLTQVGLSESWLRPAPMEVAASDLL